MRARQSLRREVLLPESPEAPGEGRLQRAILVPGSQRPGGTLLLLEVQGGRHVDL